MIGAMPEYPDYADDLRATIARASASLAAMPDEAAARRPAPGKWSPKEIIGHLVDSAANNHQRFVRAQLQDDLVFPGYDQNGWVAVQRYEHAPWQELVALWRSYNLHIARLIEVMPDEVRLRERKRHNLHELAWQPVPAGEVTTLDYFMRDYVLHLHHHLRQISQT
jgi:DinB superfamily